MLTLGFSEEDLSRCHDFAVKQYETSRKKYAERGQTVKHKVVEDITRGKLAEVGLHRLLTKEFWSCTEPDFEIYPKQKSWAPDLAVLHNGKQLALHVKSCAPGFESWVVQNEDKGFYDRPGHVAFLVVDKDITVVSILNLEVAKLWLKPLRNPMLGSKRAIYRNDIAEEIWGSPFDCLADE